MRPTLLPVPDLLLFPIHHGVRIRAEIEGVENLSGHTTDDLGAFRLYLLINTDAHITFAGLGRISPEVERLSCRKRGIDDRMPLCKKTVFIRSADRNIPGRDKFCYIERI